jgi:hypothetical protein
LTVSVQVDSSIKMELVYLVRFPAKSVKDLPYLVLLVSY